MSLTPQIAQKIVEGMRFNLKNAVLPQLKDSPYPSAQAVSTYVLLKTIAGYVSPEFQRSILESSEEMRGILREAKSLICDRLSTDEAEVQILCQAIEERLEKKETSEDPFSEYQELTGSLTTLIEALWGKVPMEDEVKEVLKRKTNDCLRKQLDRELAFFT